MENKFYVYEHVRQDTGEIFYVGKGHGKRAWKMSGTGRNRHHRNIQRKLKSLGLSVEVRVIVEGLDESTAFSLERLHIGFLGRHHLVNLTDGGEGPAGASPSLEARAKMSLAGKGRPKSAEHRAKIGEANRRRTAEVRAKIAEANRQRSPEMKERLRASRVGKGHTDEAKRKIRLTKLLRGQVKFISDSEFLSILQTL